MNSFIESLFDSDDDGELLQALYEAIGPCTEEGMSPEQRIFLLVFSAAGHASCGGAKCLLHDSAEDFEETIRAFETIGAMESAADLRRIASVVPGGKVPELGFTPQQGAFLEREHFALFMRHIVPELADWVRARRAAFRDIPGDAFAEPYRPAPPLPDPPSDAGGREVREWLHARGMKLPSLTIVNDNGRLRTVHTHGGIPEGPVTIAELTLPFDWRGNAHTLERLANWVGRASIEKIDLEDTRVGAESLALLPRFPSLRVLNLSGAHIKDDDLGSLAAVGSLEKLNLAGCRVSDEGLLPLATLPRLRNLDLAGTCIRGDALRSFSSLRELELGADPHLDGSLSFLQTQTHLTHVSIYGGALKPVAIENLSALPKLQELRVWDTGLDESALKPLRSHPHLRLLYLQGMKLTKASAPFIADIPHLEKLELGDVETHQEMPQLLRRLRPSLKTPDSE